MSRPSAGFSLVDLMVAVSILGITVTVAVPSLATIRKKTAMRVAVQEIRSVMRLGRSRAINRGMNSAIKFQKIGSRWYYALVDDMDGDGVRNDDIKKGIDIVVGPYKEVLSPGSDVAIALPSFPVRDPDTKKILPKNASPVRFNASTLCSFGPNGGGTAGSIFLTNRQHDVAMVRVTGTTGRIRAILYRRPEGTWGSL
ncbi:MAG TPA: GspH/FimT family pseudopilin [Thermoanaerobaculia bacterium]|nr:GspH/FimT family pseudopilin [Thermoanaerobaculia bacterium]